MCGIHSVEERRREQDRQEKRQRERIETDASPSFSSPLYFSLLPLPSVPAEDSISVTRDLKYLIISRKMCIQIGSGLSLSLIKEDLNAMIVFFYDGNSLSCLQHTHHWWLWKVTLQEVIIVPPGWIHFIITLSTEPHLQLPVPSRLHPHILRWHKIICMLDHFQLAPCLHPMIFYYIG